MKTATLYRPDGTVEEVSPANGTDFQLEELHKLVDTDIIQYVPMPDGRSMFIDEEGKIRKDPKPYNKEATKLFGEPGSWLQVGDFIVGNALVCDEGMVQ